MGFASIEGKAWMVRSYRGPVAAGVFALLCYFEPDCAVSEGEGLASQSARGYGYYGQGR